VRNFWRGENVALLEFASRFTGSPDLYKSTGRLPYASINQITCHDGFTLNDLVSYDTRHNEDNREESGSYHNFSWNCGSEGETDDPKVLRLREKQKRNFLTTLMLSQGVPMLLGGDEMGRSQQGNNNPYCQDNKISWFDWDWTKENVALLDFARQLIRFRHQHPVFRQRDWMRQGSGQGEIRWFNPNGCEIDEQQSRNSISAMSFFLSGEGVSTSDEQGKSANGDSFLLCFNARDQRVKFRFPAKLEDRSWKVVVDTTEPRIVEEGLLYHGIESLILKKRSLVVLQDSLSQLSS
jgi:glycogen operon protein